MEGEEEEEEEEWYGLGRCDGNEARYAVTAMMKLRGRQASYTNTSQWPPGTLSLAYHKQSLMTPHRPHTTGQGTCI